MKLRVLQSFFSVFLIAFAFFFLAANMVLAEDDCNFVLSPTDEDKEGTCNLLGDCTYNPSTEQCVPSGSISCTSIDVAPDEPSPENICGSLGGDNCEYDSSSNRCKLKTTSTTTETKTTNENVDITFLNPLGGNSMDAYKTSIATTTLIAKVISAILGLLGSVSLLVFLIGGVLYLVSGGEEAKVKKSVDTLKWAFLGLVMVFSAYAILNMVLEGLSFITGS